MKIYKVKLTTTNFLNDTATSKDCGELTEVDGGYIYVSDVDLKHIVDNYEFKNIELCGLLYQKPVETMRESDT